jgi:hypothetical protein
LILTLRQGLQVDLANFSRRCCRPGGAAWRSQAAATSSCAGLDIFATALIITGGTKPLRDMIISIETKREAAAAVAGQK